MWPHLPHFRPKVISDVELSSFESFFVFSSVSRFAIFLHITEIDLTRYCDSVCGVNGSARRYEYLQNDVEITALHLLIETNVPQLILVITLCLFHYAVYLNIRFAWQFAASELFHQTKISNSHLTTIDLSVISYLIFAQQRQVSKSIKRDPFYPANRI